MVINMAYLQVDPSYPTFKPYLCPTGCMYPTKSDESLFLLHTGD